LDLSADPVATPGKRGAFDDSGVTIGCIVRSGAQRLIYYMGWALSVTVPFRNAIGLLVSEGGDGFERASEAPILDRNAVDPFSLSYPFVMNEPQGWRMWYGSTLAWGPGCGDMVHVIKYATSEDGRTWQPTGIQSVGMADASEHAFSRPTVVREEGLYRMWFSFRGERYRIGYADSEDGIRFRRQDEPGGLTVSEDGWDKEMICYPHVFDHRGYRFMVYNGNGYGRSGFGLAVLDPPA
jgi:hypothetical protein